jgi:hypothetical protein
MLEVSRTFDPDTYISTRTDPKMQAYVVEYNVLAEARKDYEERFGGGHNVECAVFFLRTGDAPLVIRSSEQIEFKAC